MAEVRSNRLSLNEKVCYSLGDCAGQIYVALATFFLTGYYTDTVGIAAAAVGTMMLVARIFDGTSDLIMGALVDKTNTRWGKARPWILWTAPLMGIALFAMFSVPEFLGYDGKLIYAYITYILLNCIIYTANGIAYNSLLARMTLDVQDRVSCTSIRFVLGTITTLGVNAITANLVTQIGWSYLAAGYSGLMAMLLFTCFWGCKERVGEKSDGETVQVKEVPLKVAFPTLLKNKFFYLQAAMMIFLYINIMTVGSMMYFFCNSVINDLSQMTFMSMCYTIPTILGCFANPTLVSKMGKRRVLIYSFILAIIGRLLVGAAGTDMTLILVGVALHGLALGPIYSNVFAITPDVIDYGEWKTGIRSEGLTTCCVSFGLKVGLGLGGFVVGQILAFGGYDGMAATQAQSALDAIQFGFGYLSVILSAICLGIIYLLNIDQYINQIQADLTAKHG